jgi:hypothetical protein
VLCEHFVLNEIMARQQSRESRIGATNGTKTFPTARVDYELLKKLDAHGKQLMAVDAGTDARMATVSKDGMELNRNEA